MGAPAPRRGHPAIASLASARGTFLLQARTLGFLGSLTNERSPHFLIAIWSFLLPLAAAVLGRAAVSATLGALFVKLRAAGQVHLPPIAYGVLAVNLLRGGTQLDLRSDRAPIARKWSPSSD